MAAAAMLLIHLLLPSTDLIACSCRYRCVPGPLNYRSQLNCTRTPQENQQGEPQYPQGYADGQLGDQQVLYAPGFEPGCDQEPIAPPPDPLAGLSVLQREQALGLYRNMVLLPLPQQGLSGGRGGDAGRGGRGAAADRDQGSQQEVSLGREERGMSSVLGPAACV